MCANQFLISTPTQSNRREKSRNFQKPRSAKAESQVDEVQPPESKGSAAVVHKEEHGEDDDDKDSDSEMQEVYVQAYACQVFRDDAAAQAVEDGAHLRPLAMPQVRGFDCCGRGPACPEGCTLRLLLSNLSFSFDRFLKRVVLLRGSITEW